MTNSHKAAGIAILYAMIIVGLISAKLAGHIAWSWWVVLSPLWGPVALIVAVALISVALLGGASARGENPFQ